MKYIFLTLLSFIYIAAEARQGGASSMADSDSLAPAPLSERLKSIVEAAGRRPFVTALCVYDLTADTLVLAHNADKGVRPASVEKLLTASCALERLGAAYEFATRIVRDAPDTFTVRAAFDPTLTQRDLRPMARAIRATAPDAGRLCLRADLSVKDSVQMGEGWCWDDVPSTYVPYLCPLLVDHAHSLAGGSAKMLPNSDLRFLAALRALVVSAEDSVAADSALMGRAVIYTHRTRLEQVLQRMLKNSDNLYAEAVYYQLGAAHGHPSTSAACSAVVSDYLRTLAPLRADSVTLFDPTDLHTRVADGSGLSPYNLTTAATVVAVLRHVWRRADLFPTLRQALPIAGADGTLEHRMTALPARFNLRAKTGTLSAVSSLAGYVTAPDGHLLAFAIILNGHFRQSEAHALQDRIGQAMAR